MGSIETAERRATAACQSYVDMALMPMMAWAQWWTGMMQAWYPAAHPEAPHHGHHELEVPEPIEREGEHAMFA